MITTTIVAGSLLFGVSFVLVWCGSPGLRRWVERPKHRFLARVQAYDRTRGGGGAGERSAIP
jgi:hypothetical protein